MMLKYIQKTIIASCSNQKLVSKMNFTTSSKRLLYDLVVVGGGSGGLAVSREAASLGAKVALLDYVTPSVSKKTTWGLGGTCVNAGCIPKKLFHFTGNLGTSIKNAEALGWKLNRVNSQIEWNSLQNSVETYIKKLNFMYRSRLISDKIHYINGYGKIKSEKEIENRHGNLIVECIDSRSNELQQLNARYVALSTGVRPVIPSNLIGKEYCITSDDLFYLKKQPGKTLVVGGSYIAIETAGFLAKLGFSVSLAIRSRVLRNFDQECVAFLLKSLESVGVKLLTETQLLRVEALGSNKPLKALLRSRTKPESFLSTFDNIVLATGRKPIDAEDPIAPSCKRDDLGFYEINEGDETSVPNVYALGDVTNKFQLTPVAIRQGELLANRLFGSSTKLMSYEVIPTTVFGPLEFSTVGLSQEQAEEKYSKENVDVYVEQFEPLESAFANKNNQFGTCFAKVVCKREPDERILGIHLVAPHSSEIVQGFALAIGKSKGESLDNLMGIHPTIAEVFTQLRYSKRSGVVPKGYGGGISCGGGKCG